MNTNPKAIRILCYGDSNTWGLMPGKDERYDPTVRWTGVLQQSLGEGFEIIEEGLNARTTVIDDPKYAGKNGATYLKPCLQSHSPLDIVILMLGPNDLKDRFARTPEQVAQGIDTLISFIHDPEYNYNNDPKVILLAPTFIDESIGHVQESFKGAEEKSKQLGRLYKKVAEKYKAEFIDIAQYVRPSKIDGCHLDPEAQRKIAEVVTEKIRNLSKAMNQKIAD